MEDYLLILTVCSGTCVYLIEHLSAVNPF